MHLRHDNRTRRQGGNIVLTPNRLNPLEAFFTLVSATISTIVVVGMVDLAVRMLKAVTSEPLVLVGLLILVPLTLMCLTFAVLMIHDLLVKHTYIITNDGVLHTKFVLRLRLAEQTCDKRHTVLRIDRRDRIIGTGYWRLQLHHRDQNKTREETMYQGTKSEVEDMMKSIGSILNSGMDGVP